MDNTLSGPVDVLAELPDWCVLMVRVSRESFFATVGQLDVNPHAVGDHDRVLGYRSNWRRPGGETVASTIGGTSFCGEMYFVTPAFYAINRAALANVGGAK